MKEYLLSVHHGDEVPISDEEMRQSYKDTSVFNDELRASGAAAWLEDKPVLQGFIRRWMDARVRGLPAQ